MKIPVAFCILLICGLCSSEETQLADSVFTELAKTHLKLIKYVPDAVQYLRHASLKSLVTTNDTFINEILNLRERGPVFYPKCTDDLLQILFNIDKMWAMQMIDANGKIGSGMMRGNILWPGSYQECLKIYSPLDEHDHGDFYGRYCTSSWTLNVSASLPIPPLTVGTCIPNSCEGDDIANAVTVILNLSGKLPVVKKLVPHVKLNSVTCKEGEAAPDTAVIIYLIIVAIFVGLVLCGTSITVYRYVKPRDDDQSKTTLICNGAPPNQLYFENPQANTESNGCSNDALIKCEASQPEPTMSVNTPPSKQKPKRTVKDFFLCFCALQNGTKIVNVDVPKSQFLSIHGFRFLSMTWVVLGHSAIFMVNLIQNGLDVLPILDNFFMQAILSAPFSVDSFFLLSGALVAYLFLKEADRRDGKISWIYFYLHRIWRLTPVYMMLVGFYMLIYKYVGYGPFWPENTGDSCRHTWWWYLLYINNFISIKDMCVGWTWYLANDMQFYFISPLFLYPLWRWPKIGLSLAAVGTVASGIITAVLANAYNIRPMFDGLDHVTNMPDYESRMWDVFNITYDKPYCRIGPYLVGMILGYFLYKTGSRKNFLTWWQQLLGWALAFFFAFSVTFGLFHVNLSKEASDMYVGFSRISFALGIAWLLYACETGHGGPINNVLSWKIWIPVSRVTYCAYLVHPVVINAIYFSFLNTVSFSLPYLLIMYVGLLAFSYVLAFLMSLVFESPLLNLEKLLLKGL